MACESMFKERPLNVVLKMGGIYPVFSKVKWTLIEHMFSWHISSFKLTNIHKISKSRQYLPGVLLSILLDSASA
jgi:hypothetical protein